MSTKQHTLVRKRKFDGRIKSEWEGDLLWHTNEWLVVLHHPERHIKRSNGVVAAADPDVWFLHCFNVLDPLTILMEYGLDGSFQGAKCDAALPATQTDGVIEFVDLDLDVIVEPDLSWWMRDEEQFAHNREAMGYTETAVQQAHEGILLGQSLVESRTFPFDARFVPQFKPSAMLKDGMMS